MATHKSYFGGPAKIEVLQNSGRLEVSSLYWTLRYDGREAVTTFHCGCWTGGRVVKDDVFHANLLGITPQLHRLQHELTHHLVGMFFYGQMYSPVLYHAAHPNVSKYPETGHEEEWLTTALQYSSLNKANKGPAERNDKEAIKTLISKNALFGPIEIIKETIESAWRVEP